MAGWHEDEVEVQEAPLDWDRASHFVTTRRSGPCKADGPCGGPCRACCTQGGVLCSAAAAVPGSGLCCGACCCAHYSCLGFRSAPLGALRRRAPRQLLFVLHGVGAEGPRHLRYLRDRLHRDLPPRYGVHLSTASVSALECDPAGRAPCAKCPVEGGPLMYLCSNALTLTGVAAMAERAARELAALLAVLPSVRELSIVGSSLGGWAARLLAKLIHLGKVDGVPQSIEFAHFVTMGSPHLGVRHTFEAWPSGPCGACSRPATASLLPSSRDVFLHTDMWEQLCDDAALAALRRFRSRTCYCPVLDDGVVSYETAALGLRNPGERVAQFLRWGQLIDERPAGGSAPQPELLAEWCTEGSPEMEMLRRLWSVGLWRVVALSTRHGAASGLAAYCTLEDDEGYPLGAAYLATHLMRHVLLGRPADNLVLRSSWPSEEAAAGPPGQWMQGSPLRPPQAAA
eukprot:TRINITY_DN55770_c0_g1_i1.p1 TRINITY_DN55770_c0_g1~~TRINITY_DN55770_c0_g1_i1.p1  ORF type:complete len:486 (+),score=153.23 TRINITY_DN55770_c0_g1_i1:92-1459(+)